MIRRNAAWALWICTISAWNLWSSATATLSWSTFLGGNGMDSATAVAVDRSGNVYVAGWTDSSNLPVSSAFGTSRGGGTDGFVAKWSQGGSVLVYCRYLGGSGYDKVFGIAVDGAGNAYVTGLTSSFNFPLKNALQTRLGGNQNAFAAKLDPSGNLVYSTYLGGSRLDSGNAIAVDSGGRAYIVGDTTSGNFPALHGYQASYRGQSDVFLSLLNSSGSQLVYSSYLGGTGDDHGRAIAIDAAGNIYLTGDTTSTDFPTGNAFQRVSGGNQDAFVAKLSPDGQALLYGTYLGGSGGVAGSVESGTGIAVDTAGSAYVTGTTGSSNFPVANALQPYNAGGLDVFLTKFNAAGNGLIFSTYLGGRSVDFGTAVALDSGGNVFLTGYTASTDFPNLNPVVAFQAGSYDAFLTKIRADGKSILSSTYLGGSQSDSANALALDSSGNAYLAGQTLSLEFPLQNPGQRSNSGSMDVFAARISWATCRCTRVGAFHPSQGTWGLDDNGNGIWDENVDRLILLGQTGDIPVAGSWNGDGQTKAGVFRNGMWVLDYNGNGIWDGSTLDRLINLGQAGDIPVVGDWNGDGRTKVGVFRNGMWVLDYNGNGIWDGSTLDRVINLGQAGDIPVVGDWNGDGRTKVGVFRNGMWVLDYNGNGIWDGSTLDRVINLGQAGDLPLVGDWNGSGTAKIGVFTPSQALFQLDYDGDGMWGGADKLFSWGAPNDSPVVGDWNCSGKAKIGTVNRSQATWLLDLNGDFLYSGSPTDSSFSWRFSGDIPVTGNW